jgi:hypothetical protein
VLEATESPWGRLSCLPEAGSNELFAVSLFEYAVGKKPEDRIKVEPLHGSLEEVRFWVETMTGMEMTAADAIVPLDANTLLERRERLAKEALPGM